MSRVEIPKIDFQPPVYRCQRATKPFTLDGNIFKDFWKDAPFTEDFIDIEGAGRPKPYCQTQAKMLWDDKNFYFAAVLYGHEIWGHLTERDCVIFYDNDFEIFIDPDSDTHGYFEYEMNVLNTVWDLFLPKPYRDGGKPLNGWDIHGLRSAVHVEGEVNNPAVENRYWSVEVVIPFAALAEMSATKKPPVAGDYYRVNFSRVQWPVDVVNNTYTKRGKVEENWVWAPTGVINIHYPELWGFVFFVDSSHAPKLITQPAIELCEIPEVELLKWQLRQVYYYEHAYFEAHGRFTASLQALPIPDYTSVPRIEATKHTFEATLHTKDGRQGVRIYHDSRVEVVVAEDEMRYFRRPPAAEVLTQRYGFGKEQQEALQYLYSHLPLSDLLQYPVDFFATVVRHAFTVRNEMPWGAAIGQEDFLRFVLPPRINNEHLELYHQQFYQELKPRIAGMSREQATIEINFWCFEKATYQPTSLRTGSPLTTIKNAFGRCGEESVLLVAALRSVGIPARQCYVPRWSHSDDNHAWVEVQTEEGWQFLGACEPELQLNRGWFVEPASRAMALHYSSLGGKESVLPRYAKTKELVLCVEDATGAPAVGVKVEFLVVNFSEFFAIHTAYTNDKGEVRYTTGYGDLWVRVQAPQVQDSTPEVQGVKPSVCFSEAKLEQPLWQGQGAELKIAAETTGRVSVTLSPLNCTEYTQELVLMPPVATVELQPLSKELQHAEQAKKDQALETRKAFESTFPTGMGDAVTQARGNFAEILRFLDGAGEDRPLKEQLLATLSQKDLSDITADILKDHLARVLRYPELHNHPEVAYLIQPRVWIEKIEPYDRAVMATFSAYEITKIRNNPRWLLGWAKGHIALITLPQANNLTFTVQSMLQYGVANTMSLGILFVAILRTLGVIARLRKKDSEVEFYGDEVWQPLDGSAEIAGPHTNATPPQVSLTLTRSASSLMEYSKSFTIAKWSDGAWNTLDFRGLSWQENIATLQLDPSVYRIISSKRAEDGTLSIRIEQLLLQGDRTISLTPVQISENQSTQVATLQKSRPAQHKDIQAQTGIYCWIEPTHEPSVHLLHELIELKDAYNQIGVPLVFLVDAEEKLSNPLLQETIATLTLSTAQVGFREPLNPLCTRVGVLDTMPLVIGIHNTILCFAHSGYQVGVAWRMLEGWSV